MEIRKGKLLMVDFRDTFEDALADYGSETLILAAKNYKYTDLSLYLTLRSDGTYALTHYPEKSSYEELRVINVKIPAQGSPDELLKEFYVTLAEAK